jgi:hypothetical protein
MSKSLYYFTQIFESIFVIFNSKCRSIFVGIVDEHFDIHFVLQKRSTNVYIYFIIEESNIYLSVCSAEIYIF